MQNFQLKYGYAKVAVSIPDQEFLGVLSGKRMKPLVNAQETIQQALEQPIGSLPLAQKVKAGEKVAIVVSDYTRATKADLLLPVLINNLNQLGIPDQDIIIVFANGAHLLQSRAQQEKIVGQEVAGRIRMFDHDCNDGHNLVDLGKTVRGTPVKLNKLVYEADRKILTGSITYHYFAGFGGGRKAVLPGLAGSEGIQANHKLSMLPECTTAALDNNPLSLDMEEAALKLEPDFLLNTVLNEEKELCGVFAGDLVKAHRAGCEFVNRQAMVKINQKADLIIASCGGGSGDINYVQAHKSMENAHFALKEGGVMILLGECSEGFPKKIYLDYIKLGSAAAIHQALDQAFTIPGHTVYAAFQKSEKYQIIWVSKLPRELVRQMKITPADSFEEAYALARPWLGGKRQTYVLPCAYATFPVLN